MATKTAAFSLPRNLNILAALATFVLAAAILLWAKAILIPIALAVLITFLLGPLVTRLQRLRIPKVLAVCIVVVGSLGVVVGVGWVVSSQLMNLVEELPQHQRTIEKKIVNLQALSAGGRFERVGELFTELRQKWEKTEEEQETGPWPLMGPIPVQVQEEDHSITTALQLLAPIAEPLATAGLVVVLVIFLLLKREDLRNRLVTLSGHSHLAVTTKAVDEAGRRIARYLLMQFFINIGYGFAVALGLAVIGVPYAALWGVAAAVLRYIPYLGPWIASVMPITYSVLTSDGWGDPIAVVALIVVLELVVNNLVEPFLYGRNVGVSEVAVILSAVVWGWIWGPVGLILATPLTVCLVVAGRYVPALAIFNRILGDDPEVEPFIVYYQRLLAKDDDEAEELFDEYAVEHSIPEACQEILVPALEMTKRDRMREAIDADQEAFILESIVEHLDIARPAGEGEDAARALAERELFARLPLVLGYGVRDLEDEAALSILARLLDGKPVRFEILSRKKLLSEIVAEVEQRKPAALCLLGLPPGGTIYARNVCKRVHNVLPDLKIIFGRWGGSLSDRQRNILRQFGVQQLARTPVETATQVTSIARLSGNGPGTAATAEAVEAHRISHLQRSPDEQRVPLVNP